MVRVNRRACVRSVRRPPTTTRTASATCKLSPRQDPASVCDALAVVDSTAIVLVRIDKDPPAHVRITAANLNGASLAVDNAGTESKIRLTFPKPGSYYLDVTIAGDNVQPRDKVQLVEDCGAGTTRILVTHRVGAAPGGFNPLVSYEICAS